VEERKKSITTLSSDMGLPHSDAILVACSTCGDSLITMERGQHIGVRNAKVGSSADGCEGWYLPGQIVDTTSQILLLGPFKTANADDTQRGRRLERAFTDSSHI